MAEATNQRDGNLATELSAPGTPLTATPGQGRGTGRTKAQKRSKNGLEVCFADLGQHHAYELLRTPSTRSSRNTPSTQSGELGHIEGPEPPRRSFPAPSIALGL